MNWMNVPEEYAGKGGAFVILPIAHEGPMTRRAGASKGAAAIVAESVWVEYYDERLDAEPFLRGIHTLPTLHPAGNAEEALVQVADAAAAIKGFPIIIGGDHAVTIGALQGLERNHESFSVLSIDAHADYWTSYNGSTHSHATVMRHASARHPASIIGVRSVDRDELQQARGDGVSVLLAHEVDNGAAAAMIAKMPGPLYITLDVDALDPSIVRNTGTPEPGGLSWNQVIDLLGIAFDTHEVIGIDLVEFSPHEDWEGEASALAKLIYHVMALKERQLEP